MLNVVTGPPCAGKTTYVYDHKGAGDVVVDLDALAVALGSADTHEYGGAIKKAAFAARNAALDSLGDSDAWVIHSRPTAEQRGAYGDAVFHELDPGMDECLRRAKLDSRPSFTEDVIREWYGESEPHPHQPEPSRIKPREGLFSYDATSQRSMAATAQAGREANMADANTANGQGTTTTPQGEGTTQTGSADQSGTQERTYTQAEVDELLGGYVEQSEVNRLVGEARRKARSKFEGYDEYKAHAEAWADYDEVAKARDEATARVAKLEAALAHRDLVDKVADATGVPRSLLKGETEEELTASAEAVKAYASAHAPEPPAYPADKGGGANPSPITKEQIESVKDPVERVKLRAQHMDLYY